MPDIPELTNLLKPHKTVVHKGQHDHKRRSSIPATSFNFINSIVGSGIIGMPYALRQAGFVIGLFLIVIVALVTDYSIMILVEAGRLSNTDSYQDLVWAAFGRPGFYILTFFQFLYPFLAMVGYNVIIGDLNTKLVLWMAGGHASVLGNRQFMIFISTVLVTLPLSLYRDIAKLGKWAFLSITLILFMMVAAIIRLSTFIGKIDPTPDAWQFANYNVPQAVGIMAFAYMCHHNTFLIHSSMENPTQKRWGFVTHFSLTFAMLMCMIFAITGYASFTGHTQGDLMENYCRGDVLMNVSRICLTLTIMLTFPMECFVTREVIENAVFPDSQDEESPLWRHVAVTVCVVSLTVAVSMTTDCLGTVLEFNGVLCAAPLAYIIPPACVMRLRLHPLASRHNVAPGVVMVFGAAIVVVGFVMAVISLTKDFNCFHGEEPAYCLIDASNLTAHGVVVMKTSV